MDLELTMENQEFDVSAIRNDSLRICSRLGVQTNGSLPSLEQFEITRSKDEIVNRIFSMLAVAASAYGFDRQTAFAWLEREKSVQTLTSREYKFLTGDEIDTAQFMEQIEGMWALCWSLELIRNLDFSVSCSRDFVAILPDLKKNQSGDHFRVAAVRRRAVEIVAKCDLAYCLHWGIIHGGSPVRLKQRISPYVVIERRRSLEWLLSTEDWDSISLDT